MIRLIIGLIVLIAAFPIGSFLAKITKEVDRILNRFECEQIFLEVMKQRGIKPAGQNELTKVEFIKELVDNGKIKQQGQLIDLYPSVETSQQVKIMVDAAKNKEVKETNTEEKKE